MKTILYFLVCIVLLKIDVSGQEIELLSTFPFNKPFGFRPRWNLQEGTPSGPHGFLFQKDQIIIADGTGNKYWRIFDIKTMTEMRVIDSPGHNSRIVPGKTISIRSKSANISLYRKNSFPDIIDLKIDVSKLPFEEQISGGLPLYMTGGMLFANTATDELISWELGKNGTTIYRGIAATKDWLKSGNGEKIGYHVDKWGSVRFGDFSHDYRFPLIDELYPLLVFPETGPITNNKALDSATYYGNDRGGLSYYLLIKPHPNGEKSNLISSIPINVMIAVIDPWSKKVLVRQLPKDTWNPPRNSDFGLLGIFPWAVHPVGDIYFFDADIAKKEYQLKRIKNNWWSELGADQRLIGRIAKNYVPLHSIPSTNSTVNGYSFENEFVWIREESSKPDTISGKLVAWIRVNKLDGREGWIQKSNVYFEE